MKNLLVLFIFLILFSCNNPNADTDTTIISDYDFLRDFPAFTADSLVNVLIEIPAGSNQKWEVNKDTGFMEWERRGKDSLRIVRYLPYPANYGMIPRTWLPAEKGGDNDPLDVFLLGERVERGKVVPSRIVGVIRMLDKGLQDDKLIAVPVNDWHYNIFTLDDLNDNYSGIVEILSLWLQHYKGMVEVEIQDVAGHTTALDILKRSAEEFEVVGGIIIK